MNTRWALCAAALACWVTGCASTVNPDAGDASADAAGACVLMNGTTCANGSRCPAGDGCNTCSCASGRLACTLLACADASSPTFVCGTTNCTRGSQYCVHATSDVGGVPDSFTCAPLPAACGGNPSCACVASVPCGTQCGFTAQGGLVVTCPGG